MRIPYNSPLTEDFSLKFCHCSVAFLRHKKTNVAKQILSFCLVWILCVHVGTAQETVLKYTVGRDENLTEIAENYNISVAELEAFNPSLSQDIKENDVLLIPIRNSETLSEIIAYIVQPGDTKYSLSKKFGVSISTLENHNPHIISMLKVGDKISLNRDVKSIGKPNESTYIVKIGDTKFGISKKFEMSIEALEKLNPHIVPTLMVGQVLSLTAISDQPLPQIQEQNSVEAINVVEEVSPDSFSREEPLREAHPSKASPSSQEEASMYTLHTIQPGETLYGLSKQAGMSIDNFLVLNPKLSTAVQSGMSIKMPNPNFIHNKGASYSPPTRSSNYADLARTLVKDQKKKIIFLLPFSETAFKNNHLSSGTFSDYQIEDVDFFRGALLALDSAKSLGLNIEIEVMETGNSKLSADLLDLTKNSNLKSPDAIVITKLQKDSGGFQSVFEEVNVPVITTSNSMGKNVAANVFEALPSVKVYHQIMLDYLSSFADANLIVLNDRSRADNRSNILSKAPSAQFLQVNDNGTFEAEELMKLFRKNSKNIVILDTDKNGVFISATNILLREMSNFKIQLAVLEPTLIPDEDDVSKKRFVILNMLYPSMRKMALSEEAKTFKEAYKKEYNSEPQNMAIYGFEIVFDTVLRLFQSESFEESTKKITEYDALKINYLKNDRGYYSNFGVNIFQYETNDRHTLIK